MKLVIAIAHGQTWFWTQTCLAALKRSLEAGAAGAHDVEIVVVDNSWDTSPSIKGVTQTRLGEGVRVINNDSVVYTHSSALDVAFRATWPMGYFVALDSDCVIRSPEWLNNFLSRLRPTDYAVGDQHSEGGICCSFALYRGEVVKAMADASAANPDRHFRWGEGFSLSVPIPEGHEELLKGPFSDRRGWPPGTVLKERPTGLLRGPGWYEPGQYLHFWAVEAGHTYTYVPATTLRCRDRHIPLGTFYGVDPALGLDYNQCRDACWAVHFWGGTRSLDYTNPRGGNLTDPAIVGNMAFWTEREAGWWLGYVPEDVRADTLKLIQQHGWMTVPLRPDAPPDAIEQLQSWYRRGGVNFE